MGHLVPFPVLAVASQSYIAAAAGARFAFGLRLSGKASMLPAGGRDPAIGGRLRPSMMLDTPATTVHF